MFSLCLSINEAGRGRRGHTPAPGSYSFPGGGRVILYHQIVFCSCLVSILDLGHFVSGLEEGRERGNSDQQMGTPSCSSFSPLSWPGQTRKQTSVPTTLHQDGCVAQAVCLLCSYRRIFLYLCPSFICVQYNCPQ